MSVETTLVVVPDKLGVSSKSQGIGPWFGTVENTDWPTVMVADGTVVHRREQQEDSSEVVSRRKLGLGAIRKRWHNLYLNSLCLQCRIEDAINRYQ
ncbi:hypothetical protein OSTOST_18474, partial [Ostertagia ostertagi]